VEKLDWVGRKAFVRETNADYYTDAIDYTKVKPLDEFECQAHATVKAAHGEVHVVRRVAGYKKIRYYTHENVGYGQVRLPDHEMHTTALWWEASPHALAREFETRHAALEGFLGAASAVHRIAAVVSLAEPHDIGRSVGDGGPEGAWSAAAGADGRAEACTLEGQRLDLEADRRPFRPTLYLYDNFPGGIGIAAPLFDLRDRVIDHAVDLVEHCPCRFGCPACVGPVLAVDPKARHTPKSAALRVLRLLRGASAGGEDPRH
jgi:DEAD/DEAH box helicase domain-containing protein